MKKLLFILALVFVFTLSGCQNKLEKAFTNMEEVESYRMDTTMNNVPLFGTLAITTKVDGDMRYSSNPFGGDGTYSKIIDDEEYEYILHLDGSYELSDTPMESDDEPEDGVLEDFSYEDFDKAEDGIWTLIEDRLYLNEEETEYMKDAIIILNDDGYIDKMTFTMAADGMSIDVEIDFSGYNETTITLPE